MPSRTHRATARLDTPARRGSLPGTASVAQRRAHLRSVHPCVRWRLRHSACICRTMSTQCCCRCTATVKRPSLGCSHEQCARGGDGATAVCPSRRLRSRRSGRAPVVARIHRVQYSVQWCALSGLARPGTGVAVAPLQRRDACTGRSQPSTSSCATGAVSHTAVTPRAPATPRRWHCNFMQRCSPLA